MQTYTDKDKNFCNKLLFVVANCWETSRIDCGWIEKMKLTENIEPRKRVHRFTCRNVYGHKFSTGLPAWPHQTVGQSSEIIYSATAATSTTTVFEVVCGDWGYGILQTGERRQSITVSCSRAANHREDYLWKFF